MSQSFNDVHSHDAITELIDSVNLNSVDSQGQTPWRNAAREGCTANIEHQLSKGEVNATDKALHTAIKDDNLSAVKALLSAKANPNAMIMGGTPMHAATASRHSHAMMELLIASGAYVNATDAEGATPLHYCAFYSLVEEMKLLIAHNSNINAVICSNSNSGWVDGTPLHCAVQQMFTEEAKVSTRKTIDFLLSEGADVNIQSSCGRTVLHQAASEDAIDMVQTFLNNGSDINANSDSCPTPLGMAKSKMCIQMLLSEGAQSVLTL